MLMVAALSLGLAACGGSDDDDSTGGSTGNTTDQVENRSLLGHWVCSGLTNYVPYFKLYSDGTCVVTDVYASYDPEVEGTWSYDAGTRVLAITSPGSVSYAFTIKLLTSRMMSAEWTTRKGVTRNDTWNVEPPEEVDPAWQKLAAGQWRADNGNTLTLAGGKFSLVWHDASDTEKTITITGTYKKSGDRIQLTSDDSFDYTYWNTTRRSYASDSGRLNLTINGLAGTALSIGLTNTSITAIEGIALSELGTFYYQ